MHLQLFFIYEAEFDDHYKQPSNTLYPIPIPHFIIPLISFLWFQVFWAQMIVTRLETLVFTTWCTRWSGCVIISSIFMEIKVRWPLWVTRPAPWRREYSLYRQRQKVTKFLQGPLLRKFSLQCMTHQTYLSIVDIWKCSKMQVTNIWVDSRNFSECHSYAWSLGVALSWQKSKLVDV